jgi:hypothetical protein
MQVISYRTVSWPHRRYLHFDVVVGFVWSNDPESSVGGSVATGRVSLAGQVKGDDPDQKGYPGPPGLGLGVRLTTSHRKNYRYETQQKPRLEATFKGGQDSYRVVEPMMMMMTMTVSGTKLCVTPAAVACGCKENTYAM